MLARAHHKLEWAQDDICLWRGATFRYGTAWIGIIAEAVAELRLDCGVSEWLTRLLIMP